MNASCHVSMRGLNCSPELACWDVEQKRTKYWCFSFPWGTFRFCVQRLMWGLYCLLRFPEASSAHGMTRRLNKGFPPAATLSGLSDEPEAQSDDHVYCIKRASYQGSLFDIPTQLTPCSSTPNLLQALWPDDHPSEWMSLSLVKIISIVSAIAG